MRFLVYLACLLAGTIGLSAASVPATPPPAEKTAGSGDDDEVHAPKKADPAEEKFWQGVTLLGHKSTADQAAGRTALQAAADLEFLHAQTLLADCYLSGSYGFPKDPRKAVNLLRLAAERGNAFAMVSLGSCLLTGTGVRKDQEKAAFWLNAALAPDANFSRPTPPDDFTGPENEPTVAGEVETDPVDSARATAHYLLGQINTQDKKLAEGQAHYVAAATAGTDGRAGIYPAAVYAAMNYALGHGVPRDQVKANEMLDQSRKLTARLGITLVHN
ncbi:MAG TPA: tetratricopeptide repeat protein, partial [Candidatus Didemnitutus sp.]|nr:tetratricopeptide repeat protein [Candidatus Didemnitutus sp.]